MNIYGDCENEVSRDRLGSKNTLKTWNHRVRMLADSRWTITEKNCSADSSN